MKWSVYHPVYKLRPPSTLNHIFILFRLNIILTDGAVLVTVAAAAAVAGIATEVPAAPVDTISTAHTPTTLLTRSPTTAKKPAEGDETRLAHCKYFYLLKSYYHIEILLLMDLHLSPGFFFYFDKTTMTIIVGRSRWENKSFLCRARYLSDLPQKSFVLREIPAFKVRSFLTKTQIKLKGGLGSTG